jgi:uncharacterized OsmC-like protein
VRELVSEKKREQVNKLKINLCPIKESVSKKARK